MLVERQVQDPQILQSQALEICKTYMRDNSACQINIDDTRRLRVLHSVNSGNFNSGMFLEAREEVEMEFSRDFTAH